MDMKQYQPIVKNAADVLIGVAQVRVGLPSLRDIVVASAGPLQRVTQSTVITDETDGVTQIVRPGTVLSTGTITTGTVAGVYTGPLDGAFILRFATATTVDVYAPDGSRDAAVPVASFTAGYALKLEGAAVSGLTLTMTIATPAVGDTFILPAWSGTAQNKVQTGIICPYSPFRGSGNSVGAVKSASFSPKVDSVATLEAGFPSEVYDRIVTKTSVGVKFEAQEYMNANLSSLKNMVSMIINESKVGAVPVEIVMRTRGNSLISFWIPNANAENLPEIAPTNDYSSFSWELAGARMTEVAGGSATYNAWLRNTYIYRELQYVH